MGSSPWMGPQAPQPDQQDQQQLPSPPQQPPQQQQQQQNPVDALLQQEYQRYQKANNPQASGGPVKRLLQNFIGAMGHGLLPPTQSPEFERQRAIGNIVNLTNAQQMANLHGVMATQYGTVQFPIGKDANGNDQTIGIMAKDVPALLGKIIQGKQAQELQANKPLVVPQVGAFEGQAQGFAPIAGTQGQMPTVDPATAQLAGLPQAANQPANAATWANINKSLQARGFHIQDMAKNGTGEDEGMWLMDRAGNKIKQVSPNSMVYQRGVSFAQSRAEYTPFETVEPGTNEPKTISNLEAVRTGAPKVPLGTQIKMGGQYALFQDAYGILDNIENSLGKESGKVNLADPAVRGRITAAYSALRDPAGRGVFGSLFGETSNAIGNFLARQPINASLKPEERAFVIAMAQGKAAATGLRGILGQAGVNEMQQKLDSAMMPGPQEAGSNEAMAQQAQGMRGLLDRVAVGQPQAGLNAPGTATALPGTNKGKMLTADEARGYLLRAGGDKEKARALARREGRRF